MAENRLTPRKIVGISMAPKLAIDFKGEAAKRGISLKALFEEMWKNYKKDKK